MHDNHIEKLIVSVLQNITDYFHKMTQQGINQKSSLHAANILKCISFNKNF